MTATNLRSLPNLVFANEAGEIIDLPDLAMAGRAGSDFFAPAADDLIPLPPGSELFVLPDRDPVGWDRQKSKPVRLTANPYAARGKVQAVAAFMAPAHTAIFTVAFERRRKNLPPLPLFAYTAVGWKDEAFWVAAFRSDPDPRQDLGQFHPKKIRRLTEKALKARPHNRLVQHLGHCCLTYGCPAARNYFLGRWEAPLPTSPTCNARCLGCISLQPSGCCPSTQERITFVPSAAEIAEIAVDHLESAPRPVVSFGQGCEGEPLLAADTIEAAIRLIRGRTAKGTINLNSNASLTDKVQQLTSAGLDSIRVSLNSARPLCHDRYYRPKGFSFTNVCDTISVMKKAGKFVSLNYFILPGFTDDPDEFTALCHLIESRRPDLIQLRNLNMDPDWYLTALKHQPTSPPMGMRAWLAAIGRLFPLLRFGYFNPYLGD